MPGRGDVVARLCAGVPRAAWLQQQGAVLRQHAWAREAPHEPSAQGAATPNTTITAASTATTRMDSTLRPGRGFVKAMTGASLEVWVWNGRRQVVVP